MLFNHVTLENGLESEKERNLYAKFFVGFLFNPLVPGIEARVAAFKEILGAPVFERGDVPEGLKRLSSGSASLTLDKHLPKSPAECADIVIHDPMAGILLGIEVKFRSDWKFESDIRDNSCRLRDLASALNADPLLVLLITERKWRNGRSVNRTNSRTHLERRRSMRSAGQGHYLGITDLILRSRDYGVLQAHDAMGAVALIDFGLNLVTIPVLRNPLTWSAHHGYRREIATGIH